jgi:GNAT superfamily N-acetyltransferase
MVTYTSTRGLLASLDEIASVYRAARVQAWAVWVPEWDRDVASELRARRYAVTARLPAIVMDLATFEPPDLSGFSYDAECDMSTLGRVNEVSHHDGQGLAVALVKRPQGLDLRIYRVRIEGEIAAVVSTADHAGVGGRDCGLYFGATVPSARGRGLGTRLLAAAMVEARDRGCLTASGQASVMAAPIWAGMGFETVFMFETYAPPKTRTAGRQ